MRKLFSTLLLAIAFSSNSLAAAISNESIDRLLSLSGLNKQMEQMPNTVRAGLTQAKQRGANIPDAEFTELTEIIASSFQPINILKSIRTEVKGNLSESDAKKLLSWYDSKTGKKITAMEESKQTPEAFNKMIQDAKTLLSDEKNMATAKRVENALNSIDMAMQIQEHTGVAVYTAIMTAINPSKAPDIEAFKTQLNAQLPQIRARLEQFTYLTLIHSYKDVDKKSMEQYIAFLEKPVTKKFHQSVMAGMTSGIKFSTELMAQDMAQLFLRAKKKK